MIRVFRVAASCRRVSSCAFCASLRTCSTQGFWARGHARLRFRYVSFDSVRHSVVWHLFAAWQTPTTASRAFGFFRMERTHCTVKGTVCGKRCMSRLVEKYQKRYRENAGGSVITLMARRGRSEGRLSSGGSIRGAPLIRSLRRAASFERFAAKVLA